MLLFAHRLALCLGIADVDGMLAAMSATQLQRWRAYAMIEPFGFPIEQQRHVHLGVLAGGKPESLIYRPPKSMQPKPRCLTIDDLRRIRET